MNKEEFFSDFARMVGRIILNTMKSEDVPNSFEYNGEIEDYIFSLSMKKKGAGITIKDVVNELVAVLREAVVVEVKKYNAAKNDAALPEWTVKAIELLNKIQ